MIGNEKLDVALLVFSTSMYLAVFIFLVASALKLSSAQFTVYQPTNQVIFGGNASSINSHSGAAAAVATYTAITSE
jgi:hypothetical protein